MPNEDEAKGKEDGAQKVKYVRRFKRNCSIAADCKYRVLRPASLGKAKAILPDSGPGTCIKIAAPFLRTADNTFAGNAFYRRVLLAREGRERTRVRERGSRKIGAEKRMRMK